MVATDSLLDAVVARLVGAGCVAAEREAADFVSAAPDEVTLEQWIRRWEGGEPPAWITGRVEFCGRVLHVAPGVYVPRSQSEELARRAATLLPRAGRALDLCTGTGAVAAFLVARIPTATVIGVDNDVRAAACAHRNGVSTVVGDLDAPLRDRDQFEVVTAVAPYVPTGAIRLLPADVQGHEPRVALDGGPDGLDVARRVITAAGRLLHPGGWLLLEVGSDQDEALAPTLAVRRRCPGRPCGPRGCPTRGRACAAARRNRAPARRLRTAVEPRVHERDGFALTLWTYYESLAPPEESPAAYPNADQEPLRRCRILVPATVAAWRWDRDDQFPNREEAARVLLGALLEGPPWPTLDDVRPRLDDPRRAPRGLDLRACRR